MQTMTTIIHANWLFSLARIGDPLTGRATFAFGGAPSRAEQAPPKVLLPPGSECRREGLAPEQAVEVDCGFPFPAIVFVIGT